VVTFDPPDLKSVRTDVEAIIRIPLDALGISGDTNHVEGGDSYHLGANQLRDNASYSRRESDRDHHPSNAASAFDLGDGWRHGLDLSHESKDRARQTFLRFNRLYVAALKAREPGTEDIREIIYTVDGTTVERADVLGKRHGGPDSHLTHTHTSFFRDSEGRRDGAFRTLLLRLINQAISEEDFMATVRQSDWDALIWRVEALASGRTTAAGGPIAGAPIGLTVRLGTVEQKLEAVSRAVAAVGSDVAKKLSDEFTQIDKAQAETLAAVKDVSGDLNLDESLRAVLEQHASGALSADQVVQKVHDLLSAPTA
jgi:hypothetical protein